MQKGQTANTLSLPLVVFAALVAMYLATLTSDYYWDGITFALQIEKVAANERGSKLLFHQNHLFYNAIGYLFYKAVHAAGFSVRALKLLQMINALAGAFAIAVFFRLAERATLSRYAASVCAAALAVAAAWWKISTDANAYVFAVLLILLCVSSLTGSKPRWFLAGIALAGAMLVHELASLFYPAALVAVALNTRIERKARFAVRMSALAWGVTVSSYYLCAVFLNGISRPVEVLRWAASNPSQKSLSASPLAGILLFPKLNTDAIIEHNFARFRLTGGWIEYAIALTAVLALLTFLARTARNVDILRALKSLRHRAPENVIAHRQLLGVLITWLAAYVLFLLFWGPLVYYCVFYTPALVLGSGLALSNYHRVAGNRPSGAAALAVATLGLFNLGFYVAPNMQADSNEVVAAARKAAGVWDEHTVIYFYERGEADTVFEYFNPSTLWRKLSHAARSDLDKTLDRAGADGGSVWLNKSASELVDPDWLASHTTGKQIAVETASEFARYVQLVAVHQ